MARHRKPWAMTRLQGEPSQVSRGKAEGRDLIGHVEERIPVLSAGIDEAVNRHRADEWYRRIASLLEGVGVLRATDEAAVMMLAEALERYRQLSDDYRASLRDPEGAESIHKMLHKEIGVITRLSGLLGLTPASRSRFIVEAASAAALSRVADGRREFDFDA